MFSKILDFTYRKPLTALGFFLFIPFPLIYSAVSGIFDHWPYNGSVLTTIAMLGMVIMGLGQKYESGKKKDDE